MSATERFIDLSNSAFHVINQGEEAVYDLVTQVKNRFIRPQLIAFGESVLRYFERTSETDRNIDYFVEAINAGFFPIIGTNHQGYPDGPATAEISNEVVSRTRIQQFNLFVAESLRDGKQGAHIAIPFHVLTPFMQSRNTYTLGVIRDKDVDRGYYSLEGKRSHNLRVLREVMKYPQHNIGLASHIEAQVESGRMSQIYPERINGMRKVIDTGLNSIILHLMNKNIRFVFLPMAIDGSYRILSSDTKLPTLEAVTGLVKKNPKKLATVSAGRPLSDVDILQGIGLMIDETQHSQICQYMSKNPDLFFDYVMGKIAQLLPVEKRGYYRQYARALAHLESQYPLAA